MEHLKETNNYFESEHFKRLLKSIVKESLAPLHKKVDICLEELRKLNGGEELESNNEKEEIKSCQLLIQVAEPTTPTLELQINLSLKMLKNQDFSKSFVVSPLAVILGVYPFFKLANVETRKKIRSCFIENPNYESVFEHFIDILGVMSGRPDPDELQCFSYRGGRDALDEEILNDFLSTKLKYLEIDSTAETVKGSSGNDKDNDVDTIIVNTLLFNTKWQFSLCSFYSWKEVFHSSPTSTREERCLQWAYVENCYSENEDFQMVRIHVREFIYLNVFLPKIRFGLSNLLKSLDSYRIHQLDYNAMPVYLNITIPIIKIRTETDLITQIESIGVDQELYKKVKTSLYGRTKKGNDRFIHRAQFELNEWGLNEREQNRCGLVYPKEQFGKIPMEFVADHPFLFMLVKDGHLVYFGSYQ